MTNQPFQIYEPQNNNLLGFNGSSWVAKTKAQIAAILGIDTVTNIITLHVGTVGNVTYAVGKMMFSGTIVNVHSICRSGSATATTKINTTSVTATDNAVSSSNATQVVSGANSFVSGDYLNVAIASNSTCLDMCITIEFRRNLTA